MKITLLVVGKTDSSYLQEGIDIYVKRILHYVNFKIEVIPDIKKTKNLSIDLQKNQEGKLIESRFAPSKEFHLFDERGAIFSSRKFSEFIQKKMASGLKEMVFVVGGPYGFSEELKSRVKSKIALSKLTFSHQMVRLLCVEQIYRAFTIFKGEPYHHD